MLNPDSILFQIASIEVFRYIFHHDDIMAVLRLIELGRFDLKSLVEEVHSPEEAGEVYHRLATEKSFPVVQFDWRRLK